ncbi:CBS domain-containing protein [Nonomuraea sp. 3-1Str]|uniref:CBS domain-containing protein n=1 Tax=unclassified Nonomuraea TaxID=2593643 RepID=UPI00285E7919|nr:CBS domain-containing protein [Nonomuraea sp. 3-1Str]MDR8413889.1 CBS domain-containing protein [Nonomuraea sp. 3-1Str]
MTEGHPHETARDVMNPGAECLPAHESLDRAAQLMRNGNIGALPVCDSDGRVIGIITDRDIVIKCVAEGRDPAQVRAGDLTADLVAVTPDAPLAEALSRMEEHRIKRLPVVEDDHVVGMISEADLARHLPDAQLAEFVHRVYAHG